MRCRRPMAASSAIVLPTSTTPARKHPRRRWHVTDAPVRTVGALRGDPHRLGGGQSARVYPSPNQFTNRSSAGSSFPPSIRNHSMVIPWIHGSGVAPHLARVIVVIIMSPETLPMSSEVNASMHGRTPSSRRHRCMRSVSSCLQGRRRRCCCQAQPTERTRPATLPGPSAPGWSGSRSPPGPSRYRPGGRSAGREHERGCDDDARSPGAHARWTGRLHGVWNSKESRTGIAASRTSSYIDS